MKTRFVSKFMIWVRFSCCVNSVMNLGTEVRALFSYALNTKLFWSQNQFVGDVNDANQKNMSFISCIHESFMLSFA